LPFDSPVLKVTCLFAMNARSQYKLLLLHVQHKDPGQRDLVFLLFIVFVKSLLI